VGAGYGVFKISLWVGRMIYLQAENTREHGKVVKTERVIKLSCLNKILDILRLTEMPGDVYRDSIHQPIRAKLRANYEVRL